MYIIIPINLYISKRWKKNELSIIKYIFITIIISHKDNNEKMWSNKELQVSNTKCDIKQILTNVTTLNSQNSKFKFIQKFNNVNILF